MLASPHDVKLDTVHRHRLGSMHVDNTAAGRECSKPRRNCTVP